MSEATGNVFVFLIVFAFIAFVWTLVSSRLSRGKQHAPPPPVHNPNPHVQNQLAGNQQQGTGAPAPAPHPPVAVTHPPQTNPAPTHHTAQAAHGTGVGQWVNDHLWMVISWILVAGLVIAGLVLYSPKDAKWLNLSSIFGKGFSIGEYIFPGLLILVGLILLLWPNKAGSEKKGH